MSWLTNAIHQTTKPKQSIIGVLKQHLGGMERGRSMSVLHASDVTKGDFCPRRWALFDLLKKDPPSSMISAAMDVTFRMGLVTAETLIELAGEHVVGNWVCRLCEETRSMTFKPNGHCGDGRKHWWRYVETVVEAPEFGISGSIDALFQIGAPQLVVTELKIMAPAEFDQIMVPLPEHRLRTNLYMRLVADSNSPYKDKINVSEGRVLYTSRGYGRMNAQWNEILPFKEFTVKREDNDLKEPLKRATDLRKFRTQGLMPPGICHTALDKIAKSCSVCQQCFSGQFPANKPIQMEVAQ